MTNLDRTKSVLARERLGMEVMQIHGLSPGWSVPWILLNEAEALVAAVERVQAQVDKALEILDRYNHSDDGELPECAPEDRWRLYRDLLATLNPEALETP